MSEERIWSIEQEIELLSLVCDFKPAGDEKDKNITQILLRINECIKPDVKITKDQVWSKLETLFDLQEVERLEEDQDESPDSANEEMGQSPTREGHTLPMTRAKPEDTTPRESSIQQLTTPESATQHPGTSSSEQNKDLSEVYSSELSDVEGEETEIEKLEGKVPSPPPKETKRRGRPRKGLRKHEQEPTDKSSISQETPVDISTKELLVEEASNATPRKRTRSILKDEEEESAPKRRQLAGPSARRKTRSDATPEAEPQPSQLTQPVDAPSQSREDDEKESLEVAAAPKDEINTLTKDEGDIKLSAKVEADEIADPAEQKPKTRRSNRQAVRRSTRNK